MKKKQHKGKNGNRPSRRVREEESVAMESNRKVSRGEVDGRDCYRSAPNDWRWYAHTPQLIRDYASFPFGQPLGTLTQYGDTTWDLDAISGVMGIYFTPAIGYANAETDAVNVAMRNIYSYVRHANSGHTNYDAPDLMLYLLAMDSVYMYHSYLKRLYGVINDFTPYNRYYPRALVAAMGVDYNDIILHINDLRGYINMLAVKLGSMCVPNSMSYMARHSWMTEGMYVDSNSPKAQTYLYVPHRFYEFQLDDSSAGSLTTRLLFPLGGVKNNKFEDLVAFGDALFNPIITSEDMNIMSGDILKAFGIDGVVKVAGIDENYIVLPVYSEEVLSQIENATPLGPNPLTSVRQETAIGKGYLVSPVTTMMNYSTGSSTPETGSITPEYLAEFTKYYTTNRLLNFHHSNVTPEEVMVATRLTNSLKYTSHGVANGSLWINYTCPTAGSEVVEELVVYRTLWDGSIDATIYDGLTAEAVKDYGSFNASKNATRLATQIVRYQQFDWAPQIAFSKFSHDATTGAIGVGFTTKPVVDADFYTFLSVDNLVNLSRTALLSEFSVPQAGLLA